MKIHGNTIPTLLSVILSGFLLFSLNQDSALLKNQNLTGNLSKFASWRTSIISEPANRNLDGNKLPKGWLHDITPDGYIIGWALDPDNYNTQISVHAYFDGPAGSGNFPVVANANLSFRQAGLPDGLTTYPGNHAFKIQFPVQVKDGIPHSVYVHAIDINDSSGASNVLVWNSGFQFKYPYTQYATKPKISETNKWGANNDLGIAPWAAPGTNGAGLAGQQTFDLTQEAGLGWIRYTFYWNNLNPEPGIFDWSTADKEIESMTKSGLNIYGSVLWAPAWTTGGYYSDGDYSYRPFYCMDTITYLYTPSKQGCSNVTPDVNAFKTFITEAVRRYGDKIKYWGLINESANGVFWHGGDIVNNVLIPGYEAAKAVNPNIMIVGPDETAGEGIPHLDYILSRDQEYKDQNGRNLLDVISFHAYGNNDNVSHAISLVDNEFKTVIDRYRNNRPVWITEGGIKSRQATFTAQANGYGDLLREINIRSWVDKFILYRLKGGTQTEEDYGIILGDSGLPKPAYYSIRQYITGRSTSLSSAPLGSFDGVAKGDFIFGWAFDPDSPSESISVRVYFDGSANGGGIAAGGAVANVYRPDVNQTFGINGNHGFLFPFPENYKDGRNHDVYLYAIDSTDLNSRTLLPGSPKNYIIRPADSAKTVSRGVNTSANRNASGDNETSSLLQANHPIMFGYYHVDSQYGDFKNEVKDYTNTQIILEESWIRPPDITNLDIQNLNNAFEETVALGHKIIYVPAKNPNDWEQSVNLVKPYWQNIEFIYLADEPNWDKATTERNISNFKGLVTRSGLNQKQIAINYTPQQLQNGTGHEAGNLDIVGFEAYIDPSLQDSADLVQTLNSQIDASKQKIGNKKMFIVIQAYDRNGAWKNLNSLVGIQTPPYTKSYADANVIGLFLFSYARPGGTKDNGILKEPHQEIWNAISGQGPSAPQFSGQTLNLGSGVFPDVAFYQNRIWVAYQAQKPNAIILLSFKPDLTDRREEKRFTSSDLAFSHLYPDANGILWLSWRDSDDKIKLWRSDQSNNIETVSLERSGANGAIMGYGKIAWFSYDYQTVFSRDLTGGTTQVAGTGNHPTGMSRILSNGSVIFLDEDRNLFDWGLEPSFAGILAIVTDTNDGDNVRYNNDVSTQFSIFPGESFTPHAATDGSTNYAAVTWGRSGVRVAVFQGPSSNGNTERGGEPLDEIRTPVGLPFTSPTQPLIPTEGLLGFGQLVAMIFTWSLNILGIVVFVMIFYAGFMWFTAAGNTARVNEAKERITNAITGAIILLAAYIILYTINPDLVGGTFTLPGIIQ